MSDGDRTVPMIDDLALDYVTWARHRNAQRSLSLPVPGLDGDVQQVLGRASHEIDIRGALVGEDSADKLSSLQQKVITGEEVTFTADIVTALELDKVIVVAAEFEEHGGRPGYYDYRLTLRESPPLPPPAELTSPGGLGDLGMGDLGFDTDLLGDIAGMAGDLQNAIETVSGALDTLGALASLGDLGLNNPLSPMVDEAGKVGSSGSGATGAAGKLADLLGGNG
jgi:hypothetical protein